MASVTHVFNSSLYRIPTQRRQDDRYLVRKVSRYHSVSRTKAEKARSATSAPKPVDCVMLGTWSETWMPCPPLPYSSTALSPNALLAEERTCSFVAAEAWAKTRSTRPGSSATAFEVQSRCRIQDVLGKFRVTDLCDPGFMGVFGAELRELVRVPLRGTSTLDPAQVVRVKFMQSPIGRLHASGLLLLQCPRDDFPPISEPARFRRGEPLRHLLKIDAGIVLLSARHGRHWAPRVRS